ncbi:hypothetical protein AGLY_015660 [Aphis glycines]|uniref:Uncharacterized protein n=1 Tax=Aphis glycines TaxID=307491 RepID=A0A6G0T061_APHGL|nr:hypothetical protein AGLY_015660 [Aphis glycines]
MGVRTTYVDPSIKFLSILSQLNFFLSTFIKKKMNISNAYKLIKNDIYEQYFLNDNKYLKSFEDKSLFNAVLKIYGEPCTKFSKLSYKRKKFYDFSTTKLLANFRNFDIFQQLIRNLILNFYRYLKKKYLEKLKISINLKVTEKREYLRKNSFRPNRFLDMVPQCFTISVYNKICQNRENLQVPNFVLNIVHKMHFKLRCKFKEKKAKVINNIVLKLYMSMTIRIPEFIVSSLLFSHAFVTNLKTHGD